MNHLKINIIPTKHYWSAQILIDDEDLLSIMGVEKHFTNLSPDELYHSLLRTDYYVDMFANLPDNDSKTIVYCCTCRMLECDRAILDIVKARDTIIWKNFEVEGVFLSPRSFEFTKVNYDECLGILTQYMENKNK